MNNQLETGLYSDLTDSYIRHDPTAAAVLYGMHRRANGDSSSAEYFNLYEAQPRHSFLREQLNSSITRTINPYFAALEIASQIRLLGAPAPEFVRTVVEYRNSDWYAPHRLVDQFASRLMEDSGPIIADANENPAVAYSFFTFIANDRNLHARGQDPVRDFVLWAYACLASGHMQWLEEANVRMLIEVVKDEGRPTNMIAGLLRSFHSFLQFCTDHWEMMESCEGFEGLGYLYFTFYSHLFEAAETVRQPISLLFDKLRDAVDDEVEGTDRAEFQSPLESFDVKQKIVDTLLSMRPVGEGAYAVT